MLVLQMHPVGIVPIGKCCSAQRWALLGSIRWEVSREVGTTTITIPWDPSCSCVLPSTCQTCLVRNGNHVPKAPKNALRLSAIWLSCMDLAGFSLISFLTFAPHWVWGGFLLPYSHSYPGMGYIDEWEVGLEGEDGYGHPCSASPHSPSLPSHRMDSLSDFHSVINDLWE